jgi:hypothetical protein
MGRHPTLIPSQFSNSPSSSLWSRYALEENSGYSTTDDYSFGNLLTTFAAVAG